MSTCMQASHNRCSFVPAPRKFSIRAVALASSTSPIMNKLSFIVRVDLPLHRAQAIRSWRLARRAISSYSTEIATTSSHLHAMVLWRTQRARQVPAATTMDMSLSMAFPSAAIDSWKSLTFVMTKSARRTTMQAISLRQQMMVFSRVRRALIYAAQSYRVSILTITRKWLISGYPRPNFITGGFFGGKNVDNLYSRATQRSTLADIIGSYDLALTYIHETSDLFLGKTLMCFSLAHNSFTLNIFPFFCCSARGHMAAKADFIFGNEVKCFRRRSRRIDWNWKWFFHSLSLSFFHTFFMFSSIVQRFISQTQCRKWAMFPPFILFLYFFVLVETTLSDELIRVYDLF